MFMDIYLNICFGYLYPINVEINGAEFEWDFKMDFKDLKMSNQIHLISLNLANSSV